MFSGGMKSMGKLEHLEYFIHNPYFMFFGAIACTLLWQSSSLSTTAIIGLVASGALPLPSAIAAVLGANIGITSEPELCLKLMKLLKFCRSRYYDSNGPVFSF